MNEDTATKQASEYAGSQRQDDADDTTHPGIAIRNALGIAALMWIGIALLVHACLG